MPSVPAAPSRRRGPAARAAARRGAWLAGAVLVLAASAAVARGHNPDTSYARLAIARDDVSLRLTYDVTSLVRMLPGLDADGDRSVTPAELAAAAAGIAAFLRDRVACEIDDAAVRLPEPAPVAWPAAAGPTIAEADWHAPTSLVALDFRIPTPRPAADVWLEFAFFGELGLAHTVLAAIEQGGTTTELVFSAVEPDYLFEASWPAGPLVAGDAAAGPAEQSAAADPAAAAERGDGARDGVGAGPPGRGHTPRRGPQPLLVRLWLFFRLGVEHILLGYDHVLFLVALLLVSDVRSLVRIVTAFTVAHSITLAIATLGWLQPPPRLVESAIAATIVYTGLENLRLTDSSGRWRLTFLFGLIHGFGFAGVLRDLGLPREGFVRSLLAFNLGVEAGQLAIVAALALPAAALARSRHAKAIRTAATLAIAACGLGWFLDRAFGLTLMPG